MDPVTTAAVGLLTDSLFQNLVADAVSITAQRLGRAATDKMRHTRGGPNITSVLNWDAGKYVPSPVALAALSDLNVDARSITASLGSSRGKTVLNQIAASTVLDQYGDRKADLVTLMTTLFASSSIDMTEVASAAIADAVHFSIADLLEGAPASPEKNALVQLGARSIILQSTIDSVRRDIASLVAAAPRDTAADDEWIRNYLVQCIRKHGAITPPDNTRRTPVPINEIYVPGRLQGANVADAFTVYDAIDRIDRTVVLGTPGGGKSTATNAIAHRIAQGAGDRVPLVVVLREYGKHMSTASLAAYVQSSVGARYETASPPDGLIETLLRQGRAFVLLDGLDELLDPSARRAMAEKVELFSSSYPSVPLLVTSRKVGYAEAALDRTIFESVELVSYDEEDVIDYARKWFHLHASDLQLDAGRTVDELCDDFLVESASIDDLRVNPLLLALLCIIYRGQNYLPRNRIGVYEKCTELLFETWDRSRGLTYDFDFDAYIDDALKHLAHWMFTNDEGGVGVPEGPLVAEIAKFFAEFAYESDMKADLAAREFIGFCKGRAWVLTEVGLNSDDEPLFAFAHRTFLEYYTAAQLTRIYPEPEKLGGALVRRVSRNEWDTVSQLAVQITNRSVLRGAERVLERLMQSVRAANRSFDYRVNTMTFIVRCLEDLPAAPGLLRKIFPLLAKLAIEVTEEYSMDATIDYSLNALYRLDRGGEYVLLSELQRFVDEHIGRSLELKRRMLRVTASCIDYADDREAQFFRSRFVEPWLTSEDRAYEFLTAGYFAGCVTAREIVDLTEASGSAPFDFLFFTIGSEVPVVERGRYHCLAFALAEISRIWSGRMVEQFDREERRWVGTLLTDLAPLFAEKGGVFISGGLEQSHLNFEIGMRGRGEIAELSKERGLSVAVLSCILLEINGDAEMDDAVLNSLPVLEEASFARRDGSWPAGGVHANIAGSAMRERLEEWAANSGHGFVAV